MIEHAILTHAFTLCWSAFPDACSGTWSEQLPTFSGLPCLSKCQQQQQQRSRLVLAITADVICKHVCIESVICVACLQAATGAAHWHSGQRGGGALARPPQPDLHGHRSTPSTPFLKFSLERPIVQGCPNGCQHRIQILLRLRPYPVRGHCLLYVGLPFHLVPPPYHGHPVLPGIHCLSALSASIGSHCFDGLA